jgi:hypothetical protein
MKKVILLVVAIALFLTVGAMAAKKMVEVDDGTPDVTYDNALTTNVWPWVVGIYNLGYERMIGSSFGIRPRASYVGWSGAGANFFALGGDLFWHPMGRGIEGWYIGPRYDVWMATTKGASGMMQFVGAMGGYNFVYPGGFIVDIGLGAQKNVDNSVTSGTSTLDLSTITSVLPSFDLSIGWAF